MIDPKPDPDRQTERVSSHSRLRLGLWWLATLAAIFLCAGGPVPGVNESHYLTKAKHAVDASFAPGDLFLESHNAHLLATYFAGWLAQWLSLDGVAWTGRWLAWSLLAASWMYFLRSFYLPLALAPLTLVSWYFAVAYGHWAGEWAVGGFEAKSIAYPLVLFGVADAIRGRWQKAWLWLGAAVAWHPLVGGWAGLTVGYCWLINCKFRGWREQLPWWLAASALAMIGILPALLSIGGEPNSADAQGRIVASQVHVYLRLSHHLCPLSFSATRHVAAFFSLSLLIWSTYGWFSLKTAFRQQPKASPQREQSPHRGQTQNSELRAPQYALAHDRLGKLLQIGWFAVSIACVGLAIDVLLSRPDGPFPQPLLASKLLRFYWFRWSDVAVPLAWTTSMWTLVWWCLTSRQEFSSWLFPRSHQASHSLNRSNEQPQVGAFGFTSAVAVSFLATLMTFACFGWRVVREWDQVIPAADRMLVNNPGSQRKITWQGSDSNRYRDWLAVCEWIRNNTPADALFLTPKHQQSFKWHAGRAEVVCWKDVPQDNASVVEWYKRVSRLAPPVDRRRRERGWTTDELLTLQAEYRFENVLVDRTYYALEQPPPKLEIVYPTLVDNRSFAVFRIRPRVHVSPKD